MMGLELVVSVEHFNADGWADSEEYRTRYPEEVGCVAALIRYANEMTFKTPERRYLCIASRECDGDHAPISARTFLSKDEVEHKHVICPELLPLPRKRVRSDVAAPAAVRRIYACHA